MGQDIKFRDAKGEADALRADKNNKSALIGNLMRDGKKEEAEKIKLEVAEFNDKIAELEKQEEELQQEMSGHILDSAFIEGIYKN